MATVSSLSSQSSIYSLVSQLMQIERQPITKLQTQKANFNTRNAIFTDLRTKLNALRSVTTSLTDAVSSPLAARAVSTSDSAVVTATAANGTAVGSHTVAVTQLAKSHTLVSDRLTSDGTALRTALGTGDQTFSIAVNGETTSVTVTIGESDTDAVIVAHAASAITSALADTDNPVTASALTDTSTTSKLLLRSSNTGATCKMELTDTSGGLLAALGIANEGVAATDTTGGYVYADADLNARFVVDGVNVNRDSNVVTDAISGVTLTLKSAQELGSSAVSLSVTADTDAITATVQQFITKYNDALAYLKAKTAIDGSTGQKQALGGDPIYRGLLSELRVAVASPVATGLSDLTLLSEIGINQANDGSLSLSDATKLQSALKAHPNTVTALFNAGDGIASQVDALLDPFVKSAGYLDSDKANVTENVANIDSSIDRLEAKMALREQQLIKQYSNLQYMLAELNGQANYLGSYLQSNQR